MKGLYQEHGGPPIEHFIKTYEKLAFVHGSWGLVAGARDQSSGLTLVFNLRFSALGFWGLVFMVLV